MEHDEKEVALCDKGASWGCILGRCLWGRLVWTNNHAKPIADYGARLCIS